MYPVTDEQAMTALRKAVAMRGTTYVYPGEKCSGSDEGSGGICRYWHEEDDEPGCIVGTALHLLGVSAERLSTFEGSGANGVMRRLGAFSERIGDAFRSAQFAQDAGVDWGAALQEAEKRFGQELGG